MPSRSEFESQSRILLGLGLMSLVAFLLLRLLWPVILLCAIGAGGYWLWRQQWRKLQQHQRHQERLDSKFYQLLYQRQGYVSALDLAISTGLTGHSAQRYLHRQAQAFGACFQRTIRGDIVYIFNIAGLYPQPNYTPAAAARAYAERIYAEQRLAQKDRAAWEKAYYARNLRRLSSDRHLADHLPAEGAITIDVSAMNE
jgi:hypothetical protein